jgi:hypothetical protein
MLFKFNPVAEKRYKEGKCIECDLPVKETAFKNPIENKEYKVSGICGVCQRKMWETSNYE